jgi:hypothetical protein
MGGASCWVGTDPIVTLVSTSVPVVVNLMPAQSTVASLDAKLSADADGTCPASTIATIATPIIRCLIMVPSL